MGQCQSTECRNEKNSCSTWSRPVSLAVLVSTSLESESVFKDFFSFKGRFAERERENERERERAVIIWLILQMATVARAEPI